MTARARRWIDAQDARPGDVLVLPNGATILEVTGSHRHPDDPDLVVLHGWYRRQAGAGPRKYTEAAIWRRCDQVYQLTAEDFEEGTDR